MEDEENDIEIVEEILSNNRHEAIPVIELSDQDQDVVTITDDDDDEEVPILVPAPDLDQTHCDTHCELRPQLRPRGENARVRYIRDSNIDPDVCAPKLALSPEEWARGGVNLELWRPHYESMTSGDTEAESDEESQKSLCDNPSCTEHGDCVKTEAEEDVCETLEDENDEYFQNVHRGRYGLRDEDLPVPDPETETVPDEERNDDNSFEEGLEDTTHASMMAGLDQVICSLAKGEENPENSGMLNFGHELSKIVENMAPPGSSNRADMARIIDGERGKVVDRLAYFKNLAYLKALSQKEAETEAQPTPSTSQTAEENRKHRVRDHRIDLLKRWLKSATRDAEMEKAEAEATLREIERKIEEAAISREEKDSEIREALISLMQCNEEFYYYIKDASKVACLSWSQVPKKHLPTFDLFICMYMVRYM